MRCLVTGAAGFLGSHLLARLLQKGHEITLILRPGGDRSRILSHLSHVQIIECDLRALEQALPQIRAAKPESVFHLAWQGGNSARHQNEASQISLNLPVAMQVLHCAVETGAQRWIGFGSAFEYGNLENPLREDQIPLPHTLYAISKYALCLSAEKICKSNGLDYFWIRPFATYGAADDPRGLVPFVVQKLLRGERPALTGGEQQWDYLHATDAADAVMRVIALPGSRGIYNVASGQSYTIRTLVENIRDLINPDLPLGFGEIPYHPDQIMRLQANVSKLKNDTGWTPQVSLREGLKRVIEEFREITASAR